MKRLRTRPIHSEADDTDSREKQCYLQVEFEKFTRLNFLGNGWTGRAAGAARE